MLPAHTATPGSCVRDPRGRSTSHISPDGVWHAGRDGGWVRAPRQPGAMGPGLGCKLGTRAGPWARSCRGLHPVVAQSPWVACTPVRDLCAFERSNDRCDTQSDARPAPWAGESAQHAAEPGGPWPRGGSMPAPRSMVFTRGASPMFEGVACHLRLEFLASFRIGQVSSRGAPNTSPVLAAHSRETS